MKLFSAFVIWTAKRIPRGYAPLLRFAAHADPELRDFPISLGTSGIVLRADLLESVYIGLFRHGRIRHQAGLDELASKLIKKGDLVFDIGANVGYTAGLFSSFVGLEGRVVAVEPVSRTFTLLQRSLSECPNISLLQRAMSDKTGEIHISVSSSLDLSSAVQLSGGLIETIQSTTIDALCTEYGHPALIKIDVEGYEPNVLRGASCSLNSAHPPIIIFEALNTSAFTTCMGIIDRLSDSSYTYFRVTIDGLLVSATELGTSDFVAYPGVPADSLLKKMRPALR